MTARPHLPFLILAPALLAGCGATMAPPSLPDLAGFMSAGIEVGPDGTCFGRDIEPAVVQTVTAQELETPAILAEDGSVLAPAVYRSVIRQEIVRERSEVLFETLCPPDYTPAFVESLQRALAARGFYRGAVTGHLDAATGRAIQDFQREDGPDSPVLSLAAARRLGLVALSRAEIDRL